MGAQTAARGGMYDPKYLERVRPAGHGDSGMEASIRHQVAQLPHYDDNPASAAYFCNSVRNVLKTYGASTNQAILNAFSYKLKGSAYENFMNDASQHTSVEKALEFIAERYKYRGGADHVLAEI